jgi:phage tail sheath protein FI
MGNYAAPGVYVEEVPAAAPIAGVGTSTPAFIGVWADITGDTTSVTAGTIVPVTNMTEFKSAFGDFTAKTAAPGALGTPNAYDGLNTLGHAVRGFFDNGGTFCYVARAKTEGDIDSQVLAKLEAYDDVAMLAAPGVPADPKKMDAIDAIVAHCAKLGDRIAILDAPYSTNPTADLATQLPTGSAAIYQATDFAAVYTPWFVVHDDALNAERAVPPSGHVAGIYARVDATRGVHKAPANEQVLGVLRPVALIGRAQQASVNLLGGNCIRTMQGAIKVWGARTLAGDASLHKYVPIRRLLSFLYKSIDHGTQWAVFEPNGPDLWARIIRNVGSFLTGVWEQGALAGDVAAQAFYVKCDAENNPPDQRANGLLVVEVGVATVFPAEFVVFRIQQYTGPIK